MRTSAALAGSAGGRWKLILNHQAGSLDQAVSDLLLRNLLVLCLDAHEITPPVAFFIAELGDVDAAGEHADGQRDVLRG